jgi:hypothetical protein
MPVTITPVAKKIAGINYPIDHETFPNDCENVACTKIEGRYRPGSWIIVVQEFDCDEEEFYFTEQYACLDCQEKCKKSFNGLRVKEKKEAEPVLKKETQVKANIAVSKLLTWVMKPKPKIEEKKPIIISAPMKLVPKRPMEKRTAEITAENEKSKPWIKRERKPRSPSPIRPKNDRDAIPWAKVERVKELTKEEYEELVRQ